MINRRNSGDTAFLNDQGQSDAESLTLANSNQHPEPVATPRSRGAEPPHVEEHISLFWRVFGGTILSIIALALVTVYNNLNSNLNDLRNEISRSHEARAELVKKEEFNTRNQTVWNKLQEVQEMRGTITAMRDQMASMAESRSEQKSMIERISVFEQRLKSAEEQHKTLSQVQSAISGIEQKLAAREAQGKSLEDDRKDLGKQILELRERLAKIEALADYKSAPKNPGGKN